MKDFELAVQKFLEPRKDRDEVIWAIICGSYVTWNPSEQSDIDLHILLDDSVDRRERWNTYVGDFLIEYFMNPIRQHYRYAEEDYEQRRIVNAHMFATWKIVFDKTGELQKLIDDMKEYTKKTYDPMNKISIELAKYWIRDMCDNLKEIHHGEGKDFAFVYHNFLWELFEKYSNFLQYRSIEVYKIYRFLSKESDRKKYDIADFPDQSFKDLFLEAIENNDISRMMEVYEQLTNHVLKAMWWFNIDWWKLRTECEL